jgi:hypothetical protein
MKSTADPRENGREKYLIFKGSGGLAHMLSGLSDAIKIASRTGRYLVIDCEAAPAFQNRFDKYFHIIGETLNYGCSYDELPDALEYQGMPLSQIKRLPAQWKEGHGYSVDTQDVSFRRDWLGRPTTAIRDGDLTLCGGSSSASRKSLYYLYSLLVAALKMSRPKKPVNKSIRVHDEIRSQIEERFDLEGEYMALHFRNTDIRNDVAAFLPRIRSARDRHQIDRVVVATDDHSAMAQFSEALPEFRFFQYTIPDDFGGKNIHYHSSDKDKQIYDCLLDIFIMLNSSVFIPSMNSGLSMWVITMVEDGQNLFGIRSNIKEIMT